MGLKALKNKKITHRALKRKEWFKKSQKQSFKKPKLTLEDLSEEDFSSDENLSLDEEECGTLTNTSEESSGEEYEDVPEPEGSVSGNSSDEDGKQKKRSTENNLGGEADSRTIFVGNLPNTVKKIKLKKWFSKYGKVECVRLRCPPRSDPTVPKKVATIKKDFHEDRSNIHAFVRFLKGECAQKALEANGTAFDGTHHIRVDFSIKPGSYDAKRAIFIGNLPFGAEEDQLRSVFAECGDIESIRIVRDKKTCVGKGFAYVNFKDRHSVQLALELDGETLGKRELRVQKVEYKTLVKETKTNQPTNKKGNASWKNKSDSIENTSNKNDERISKRKKYFQGEMGRRKEKKKNTKKFKSQKKKEVLKKILNQPMKKKIN